MARLLIVDDVAAVRLLVRVTLEQAGHEVHEAIDATSGIDAYQRVQPDVLLLDIGMPGGGGPYVLKALRQDDRTRVCPVIVITGNVEQTPDEIRKSLAVDRVLMKPFRASELRAQVADLLARADRAAKSSPPLGGDSVRCGAVPPAPS